MYIYNRDLVGMLVMKIAKMKYIFKKDVDYVFSINEIQSLNIW
jgi:hypothetical protein